MIEITKDKKAADLWTLTTTDSDGFHRQLYVTTADMNELMRQWRTIQPTTDTHGA